MKGVQSCSFFAYLIENSSAACLLVSFNAWSFSLRPILLSLWVFWAWTKPLPFKVQNSVVVRGNKCYRAGKIPRKFLTPTWPIFPFEQQKSHSLDKMYQVTLSTISSSKRNLVLQLCALTATIFLKGLKVAPIFLMKTYCQDALVVV